MLLLALAIQASAFTYKEGRSTLGPYPTDRVVRTFPDSLTPVFVNHVSRHGSRYPAGSYFTLLMKRALDRADSLNTITPLGRRLLVERGPMGAARLNRRGRASRHSRPSLPRLSAIARQRTGCGTLVVIATVGDEYVFVHPPVVEDGAAYRHHGNVGRAVQPVDAQFRP